MEAVAREREMEFSFQWKPPVIGENLFSDEASIKTLIEGVQRTSGASLHGSMVKKKKKNCFLMQIGKQWKQWQSLFSWAPKSLQMVTAAIKLKDACSLAEKLWQT